jgi:hypothetical protein
MGLDIGLLMLNVTQIIVAKEAITGDTAGIRKTEPLG